MPLRLVERLNAVRHRYFVGREPECALFKSAISAPELPFSVLYIFGPGGVGKTTLLWQLAQIGQLAQIPSVYLDGRTFEPSPQSFLNALQSAMQLAPDQSARQILTTPSRRILLIDSYERLASLEDWLREEFLPQLPEQTMVVLAGRCPPASAWRIDPGWQALFHPLALQNLTEEESQLYLAKRSVPMTHYPAIVNFTHGHPLALSLTADLYMQKPNISITSDVTPHVIKALLETFLEEVPSSLHRMALEACTVVRLMTEALLAELLDMPDVHELFQWLRGLSFIEIGSFGLMPHDMVREVVMADLRWRNPSLWETLHHRARNYYSTRLEQTHGQEQHHILSDYLFLHHHQPVIKSHFVWNAESNLSTNAFCDSDRAAILEIVTEHEGKTAAHLASHWLTKQPQNVIVLRDADRQVAGFLITVALHQTDSEDLKTDPATSAAWNYLQKYAPLRSGEGAILYRFWMARETYQSVSPPQSLLFMNAVQHYRNTPGIAFTFFSCAEPGFWAPLLTYAGFSQLSEADFEIDGRRYGVCGHDWRMVPSTIWWEQLVQQEISTAAPTPSRSSRTELPVILDQAEFEKAVREALRYFARPDALHKNPLLRSRFVIERSTVADRRSRVEVLQSRLREATELLQSSPRDEKLYRVLYRTYLHPALTQEQAAELLDLPFSTYRRYLKAGIARVAGILWQQEVLSA